jgi:hypothetical protein
MMHSGLSADERAAAIIALTYTLSELERTPGLERHVRIVSEEIVMLMDEEAASRLPKMAS